MGIFATWRKRISGDTISNSHALALAGYSTGRGRRSKLTMQDAKDLVDAVIDRDQAGHPLLADEASAAKGRAWLRSLACTPKGALKRSSPFTSGEVDIIADIERFELIDFWVEAWGLGIPVARPVWRAVGRNGDSFAYYVPLRRPQSVGRGERIGFVKRSVL